MAKQNVKPTGADPETIVTIDNGEPAEVVEADEPEPDLTPDNSPPIEPEPEEPEGSAPRFVKYVGIANKRILTREEVDRMGHIVKEDLVWSRDNQFRIAIPKLGTDLAATIAAWQGFEYA